MAHESMASLTIRQRQSMDPNTTQSIFVATMNIPPDATPVDDLAAAALSPNNPSYTSRETEPANNENVPRAKINISLKKKPKSSSSNQKWTSTASTSTLLADEYATIAEEAEIISRRRQEEGTVLIIPCTQSKNELDGHHTKQPLLAGRLASLRMQQSKEGTVHGAVRGAGKKTEGTGSNKGVDALDDETVITQLIQSAEQSNADKEHANTYKTVSNTSASARGGLVISAPSRNKLNILRRNNDDDDDDDDVKDEDDEKMDRDGMTMNDDELFKRELSHHAADIDPTSNVYANVAIHDFGSALLRGMGWTGGPETSKKDETHAIKPRSHRLGLGATPLLPIPTASGGRTSNGVGGLMHRRARRPDEVKRDEDQRQQQEEAERREEEKKRLDVQYTLQKGSIVHVINQDGDATRSGQVRRSNSSSGKSRALVIRTAGVPGLNRILIQMEGSSVETSVTKHSVSLCSWEELKLNPYERNKIQSKPDTQKVDCHSQKLLDDKKGSSSDDILDHGDARSSTTQCCYKEGKRRKRDDHGHRSRSRSGSREKTNKRKKETSGRRGHRDDERYHRSRGQNSAEEENSSSHHRKYPKNSRSSSQNLQQLHWLIPNIRVRVISEKLPKYYLKKGIVQDVLRSSSRDHGNGAPKATLLMDSGQVLDKVSERYLETAIPKTGGNVIILEGTEDVRWKMGRLLERSSKDGQGTIQLEEDLNVVRVSLDSIAEWCG